MDWADMANVARQEKVIEFLEDRRCNGNTRDWLISGLPLRANRMVPDHDQDPLDETRSFTVLAPGTMISHYKIIEKIGSGGMGVVYKAEDTKLRRHVALKFLPPDLTRDTEAKERFIQEAQAASALEHNNICTIHAIDETDDSQLFISMACYDGETLREKLRPGALRAEEALDIAIQSSQGLLKAHQKGIVWKELEYLSF